jgi:hypothetical protein
VQERIGLVWIFLQRLDSFGCRQYRQSNFAAMRFALLCQYEGDGLKVKFV